LVSETNRHIRQALSLARELLAVADEGDMARTDDGCGVLFGVMRDCAYRIRAEAERERDEHKLRGTWEGEAPNTVDPRRASREKVKTSVL
jgi:hypothetical protein